MRYVRSLFLLGCIALRETARILIAFLRGDRHGAGAHARVLAVSVHDDLVTLVTALQRLVPLRPRPSAEVDRVLIVKLDRIGDMVTTTPVFDALHALFPKARLDIVGHPGPLSLLEGDERIGERFAYQSWLYHPCRLFPPRWGEWVLAFRMLRRRYPLVVYLRGSFPFLLLALTSRVAAAKFLVAEPVITRYLKALESLFGPLPHPRPRLHVGAGAARCAEALLSGGGHPPGPRVVIHAAASAATKIWPLERFAALADQLAEVYGAGVHFLAGPGEKAGLETIARLAGRTHSYHGTLRLSQVVALIAAADLFIGNDSGLSHIAAAVGTRLVVLWGPANLSMARPQSPPEDCVILYHDLPCRERCPEFRCNNPTTLECLRRIQTADVLEACRQLLKGFAGLPARRHAPAIVGAPGGHENAAAGGAAGG
jgi:ADP-heptose:LPS heptosyltransferase